MSHPPMRGLRRVALTGAVVLAAALTVPLMGVRAMAGPAPGVAGSTLYVNPVSTTLEAAQKLTGQARADAQVLGTVASAQWFTEGTPAQVKAKVSQYVGAAADAGRMPVLVAYDIPYRDCSLYSAGGAADTKAYEAWIDGFVAGIAGRPATVILEPDGLDIIPFHTSLDGSADSCQPADADPATASSDRFTQLNYAVDALKARAGTSVYLDGTGSSWLAVNEMASRLVQAGVTRADGFFLNVSNYQFSDNSQKYGTWVSQCIAYTTVVNPGAFRDCGNQYWSGGPAHDWTGTALSQYGHWSADAADPALNTSGIDSRYESILGGVKPTTHFVIDTSRNGAGPWPYPQGVYSDAQDWCNPPGRGLGTLPSTTTGVPLLDANLWVKVPGESDGECYRGTAGPNDPARGSADPAAGGWFPQMARELLANAAQPLRPLTCTVTVKGTKVGAGFVAAIVVQNTGSTTLKPWTLSWTYGGPQKTLAVVGGTFKQRGTDVTVTAPKALPSLAPGKKAAFAVTGLGSASVPWQFRLNGAGCYS